MRALLFLVSLALIAGCGHNDSPGVGTPAPVVPVVQTTVVKSSYAWIDANVLRPSCTKCHSGADAKGDIDTSSYENLMEGVGVTAGQPLASILYSAIDSNRMPTEGPKLSPEAKKAVYDWIQNGAKKE